MRRVELLLKILAFILALFTVISILYWAVFPQISPIWTGFGPYDEALQGPRSKTLWDWLDLLIIPLTLSVGIWFLDKQEKQSASRIEEDRQRQSSLNSYFEIMTDLLSKGEFYGSEPANIRVRSIARIRTLTVLSTLDGERKGQVLQFLQEARLISNPPLIHLTGADLRNAVLENATLQRTFIRGAYLQGSNLRGANLEEADFQGSDLSKVNLSGAILDDTTFRLAILQGAIIRSTDIRSADISLADFGGVDLTGSQLTSDQLIELKYSKNIILPNTSKRLWRIHR